MQKLGVIVHVVEIRATGEPVSMPRTIMAHERHTSLPTRGMGANTRYRQGAHGLHLRLHVSS